MEMLFFEGKSNPFFWGRRSLLGVYYHFMLASVHCQIHTKNLGMGPTPPPLFFGNAKTLRALILKMPPKITRPTVTK